MKLRYYQEDAVDAVDKWLCEREGNPCIVVPTGGGKSPIMGEMIRRWRSRWPGVRICVLAHVKELVQQNHDKLKMIWPDAPAGIYSAGLGKRQGWADILFASIQTLARSADKLPPFHIIVVDEAHRIPEKGDGMYRKFIARQRERAQAAGGDVKVCGLTATPWRLGKGVVVGDDCILNAVCYEIGVGKLIEEGYLSRLDSRGGKMVADLSKLRTRSGEFTPATIEEAMNNEDLVAAAVEEIIHFGAERRGWIVFSPNVKHAKMVAAELGRKGIHAPVVTGETPTAERDQIIAAFKRLEHRCLVNVNVLSEGVDATHVDLVALMRPTQSAGLYYQQVGRGMRLHPGKESCIVLDFAGNIARHGPVDTIKVRAKRKRGEAATEGAPTKACPSCQSIVLISQMICPNCGHQWPEQPKHDEKASGLAVLSSAAVKSAPMWLDVMSVHYAVHSRRGKKPCVKVGYEVGPVEFVPEYVHPQSEHDWVRRKCTTWWQERTGSPVAPTSAHAMVAWLRDNPHPKPSRVRVDLNGKYPEILAFQFPNSGGASADGAANGDDAQGGSSGLGWRPSAASAAMV